MDSSDIEDFPRGDYAPHILSGAINRRQSGRRSPGLNKPSGCYPWYTTYVIDQGPFKLMDAEGRGREEEGPAVVCLPPNPKARIMIPSSTLYSWLEWGAIRLPLCYRDHIDSSRKYPEDYAQPPPEDIWGRPLPLLLQPSAHHPTAGMMVRVNASWWKGGLDRMLANAELGIWIARHLFDLRKKEDPIPTTSLFPLAGDSFQRALRDLENNLALGIDIRDWARALEMSPRSIQRWCRKETGLSPQEVLDRVRLEKAEELLGQGDRRLADIARQCGFASAPAFSAWFTGKRGVSPRRWASGLSSKQNGAGTAWR